jgi:hypothetical protein
MKYAIWYIAGNHWVDWIFAISTKANEAPYTDLNTAYRCMVMWWPNSYKDLEVREISEEEIQRIKKGLNQ